MKYTAFFLVAFTFLSLFTNVLAFRVVFPSGVSVVVRAGLKVYFGDSWFHAISTDVTITKWYVSDWVNYTVLGTGIQELYNGTEPTQVWIDGVSEPKGTGWTYSSNIVTVTTALSNVSIGWGIVPIPPVDDPPVAGSWSANTTTAYSVCQFNVSWTDDNGLSFGWLGTNITGSWVNQTALALTGVADSFSDTATLPISSGVNVGWIYYANDTAGQESASITYSLITTSALLQVIYGVTSIESQSVCTFYLYIIAPPSINLVVGGSNATGVFINETTQFIYTIPSFVNFTTALPYSGKVEYSFWIRSAGGQWNQTGPIVFTVQAQTAPSDPPYVSLVHPGYTDPLAWYFTNNTHTLGNISAYAINETQSASVETLTLTQSGSHVVQWGWRFWLLYNTNDTSELSNGYPVAIVSRSTSNYGEQTGYWQCPRESLALGLTSVLARLYVRFDSGSWQILGVFCTDWLLYSRLECRRLSIITSTQRLYIGASTVSAATFGDASVNSRMLNVSLTNPTTPEMQGYWFNLGDWITGLLLPATTMIGNWVWTAMVVVVCGMVVIRQRTLKPLVFWFILFGGVGGVFNILTGEVGGGVALMIVMFTMAGIIYRVFR